MWDEQQEGVEYPSSFEIMINEDCMVSSYVMEEQMIKFPNVDLVVDQHGINSLSDPNTHFDRIKIETKRIKELEVLGKGSAGEVRRAVYELNGKEYVFAVKSINATQQEHRKQLLNDLREYLYGGHSEYLIEFYTCFFHDGLVKQVIEYMDMGSLRSLIHLVANKQLVLSEEEIAAIAHKILNGLEYIHTVRHSIHRDIKPENILLNSKGDIKITDFGVSKCIENSACRSVVGTITYMSPERLSLDQQSYTYKCDIWSLGLILFELATGRPIPYTEHKTGRINYFQVSEKILKEPPPELPPNQFSPDFSDFLRQCLLKNEAERSSASALLNHRWLRDRLGKGSLRDVVDRIVALL